MNKFELYTMIFMTLDFYWDTHKGDDLGVFLSSMNPFLFKDIGSAVPNVYHDYEEWIDERKISVKNSYCIAKEYIASVNENYISEAFAWVTEEEWIAKCKKYLETDHKGAELPD